MKKSGDNNMIIDQQVYLIIDKTSANYLGISTEESIIETKIISIGNKYATVDYKNLKFDMSRHTKNGYPQKYNEAFGYYMHESRDDILELVEHDDLSIRLLKGISDFYQHDFDIHQLRAAVAILRL